MPKARTILTVAVGVLLLTAGCLGATDDAAPDAADAVDTNNAAEREDAASEPVADEVTFDDAESASASGGADTAAVDRQLIRTAKLELEVEQFDAASEEARTVADEHGGYVSDSSQETVDRHNETRTVGEVVIRVPSDSFDEAVADLRGSGEVRSAETSSEDVTDQLVDIEARLENLRAERDRLRELYDDAEETEDVLAVQRELASVQEEIERLEARQRALEDRVAYATITVTLVEPEIGPPEKEAPDAWHETGITTAFLESVSGLLVAGRAGVVAAAYAAPFLLAFGTPVVGAIAGYHIWRSR